MNAYESINRDSCYCFANRSDLESFVFDHARRMLIDWDICSNVEPQEINESILLDAVQNQCRKLGYLSFAIIGITKPEASQIIQTTRFEYLQHSLS